METKGLEKSIGQIFNGGNKYIVPLYQRGFAWRREQIEQLLQDIYVAYKSPRDSAEEHPYFIGSLVVLKRNNGDFEVIDGQQRLTTLSLITKILGVNKEPRLFYDSRPEVESFFELFYKSEDHVVKMDAPQVVHLKNAIEFICDAKLNPEDESIKILSLAEDLEGFKNYFSNNVYLVQVEIPEDTDVAAYFEIMNNRGEQLQKHEILKARLMENLCNEGRAEFAKIWDACSQMDIPIQKLFSAEDRRKYFGDSYDTFLFDGLTDKGKREGKDDDGKTITELLAKSYDEHEYGNATSNDGGMVDEDESEYSSIIDFPNFLMHVMKVLYTSEDTNINLNEKFLLSTYDELKSKVDPTEFIDMLFYLRTVFDRYIIKTIPDTKDAEDGERWTLRRPCKYETSWKYVDTFGLDNKDDNNSKNQERVVKALSMLQVSVRNRIYKNWLYEILKWFADKREDNNISVPYEGYIEMIDGLIYRKFKEIKFAWKPIENFDEQNYYNEGTSTSHYLLNLIDYIYWVGGDKQRPLKHFDFKYWNSVEHHMAREWADRNGVSEREKFIDCLGNLCLISKSSNSRLSDRDVREKVETFGKGNLGANRQVMYEMTRDRGKWGKDEILEHYNDLMKLLKHYDDLMELLQQSQKILQH